MAKQYNWAILGLGKIAKKFAADLNLTENGNLYAVASRSQDKADAFAAEFNADIAYGSYEAMMKDKNIDAVYIATPHVFHCKNTLMCLDAGFHVLCEKAFGMNKGEVQLMVDKARKKGLFLMEALWTRFIPGTERMLELIKNDTIGDIKLVKADFGFRAPYNTTGRLFSKELGGGSLLDVGIYPIFMSLLTLGKPKTISAFALMTPSEVDYNCAMYFGYDNDASAILDSSFQVTTPVEAWIHGTKSALKLNSRFHHCERIDVMDLRWKITDTIEVAYTGNGYYHEIIEVMDCLDQGKTESDKMPLSFSLDLIETLDAVREKIGLVYPNHD